MQCDIRRMILASPISVEETSLNAQVTFEVIHMMVTLLGHYSRENTISCFKIPNESLV